LCFNSRIYNAFLGVVESYQSGTIHVNKMEEATSRLEEIVRQMQSQDEILQLEGAVDTETGRPVKKRKKTNPKKKSSENIYTRLEREWRSFKYLSQKNQFQIRYAEVSQLLHYKPNHYVTTCPFLQQMFQDIWEDQNVPPEGRWPKLDMENQEPPPFPFQLMHQHIIPDMLKGTPLEGHTWGQEQVGIKEPELQYT
jgi:hypothetical protein